MPESQPGLPFMAITYTPHTLDKLELLLKSLSYKVRYDKGNFRTGACVVENSKMIVVNKFSSLESKILALIDLIQGMDIDESQLEDKQKQLLYLLKQTKLQL